MGAWRGNADRSADLGVDVTVLGREEADRVRVGLVAGDLDDALQQADSARASQCTARISVRSVNGPRWRPVGNALVNLSGRVRLAAARREDRHGEDAVLPENGDVLVLLRRVQDALPAPRPAPRPVPCRAPRPVPASSQREARVTMQRAARSPPCPTWAPHGARR